MKIVVIIPTYNEEGNIGRMLSVLEKEVFPKVTRHSMYILVADDKSSDGTENEIKEAMKKYKNIELITGNKEGLGAAYARAMKHAQNQMDAGAVIELDADFQHDPHDVTRLIDAMDEGADYVIGSRYIPGGKIPPEWGLYRKFVSFYGGSVFGRLVLWIWSIHDITSGYKLTRTSYLKKVDLDHLYSKYYAYKIHILHDVVRLGAKVKEVPIIFYERKKGSSKIEQKDLFDSFWVVIRLRIKDSEKFLKFLVVGGIGFIINFVVLKVLSESFYWNHSLANLVGAAIAIFSNYNLNNVWTFGYNRITGFIIYIWKMMQFYATSAFGVIFIQTGTIFLGDRFIGEGQFKFILPIKYYYIYFVVGTGLLLIWNFTMYSRVIWKKPQK
ncbi:MAG: glycosyltransferase [Patescibacteria group bacterium]|nr:glycosyltransferase [Patescibacteria group bacterium]